MNKITSDKKAIALTVIVSALGYFVDIYDLLLFGIVRTPSLIDLGVSQEAMLATGLKLINYQMSGMLIGGIIWGILGDKRGRRSVLFGSILLYSIANIANAYVTNVEMYAVLRFLAGIGLAGELGAAVTLVAEIMSKAHRGIGTTIVASVGILGAVAASIVGDYFSWQKAYIVGGAMGLALLVLRFGLLESGLFDKLKNQDIPRGNFLQLFTNIKKFKLYLYCILIGTPIWYVIGILITFAPELTQETFVQGTVTGSKSIMWAYVGLSLGDLSSGLLSQYLKSRKKVVGIFLALTFILVLFYAYWHHMSLTQFYILCALLGFGSGYWAVFVTIAAEQFGTNIRATVAITVPNFVRGSLVLFTLGFKYFKASMGTIYGFLFIGGLAFCLATFALTQMHETFGKDLDYHE